MEPDDLLCARNARPPKALVGRAQWKINQPPSLKRRASLEGEQHGTPHWSCATGTPPLEGLCSTTAQTNMGTLPKETERGNVRKAFIFPPGI